MGRLNDEFAKRSSGTTYKAAVQFEYDETHSSHPWVGYVGDESTHYKTLQEAIDETAQSLREAADVLDSCDAFTQ